MAAAIALPYSMPTSSAMASASASGSRESALLEQRDEEVVVADGELEAHLRRRDPVALRRAAGARGRAPGGDLEVAAAGQLVEVVAGDVGVEVEPLGHLGGRDAAASSSLRSWAKR